jgi:hypothetical protein
LRTFPSLTTVYIMSGARDDGNVATSIACTNVSGLTASMRFLVLHADGGVAGVFASNVLHGRTVVVSTHETTLFIEGGYAGGGLIQGAVNVESTQSGVFCSAAIVDADAAPEFSFPLHVVRVNPHPGTVE